MSMLHGGHHGRINQGGVDQRRIQQEATTLAEKYGGQLPDSIGKRLDKE